MFNFQTIRFRIFIGMLFLVVSASLLQFAIFFFHFKNKNESQKNAEINKIESSIKNTINYDIENYEKINNTKVTDENFYDVFKVRIFEISAIHNSKINFYDTEGNLMLTTQSVEDDDFPLKKLKSSFINEIIEKKYTKKDEKGKNFSYVNGFSVVFNSKVEPIAYLNVPFKVNELEYEHQMGDIMKVIAYIQIILILGTIFLAFYFSKQITNRLSYIGDKINKTKLAKKNQPIIYNKNDEIQTIVNAYNEMVDEIERSSDNLIKTEREFAWREMARQVAHEIKNPLTPMRLMIQSFKRSFKNEDEENEIKVQKFTNSLVEQVDTLTSISESFSDFSKITSVREEVFNAVEVIKNSIEIFNYEGISFLFNKNNIHLKMDRSMMVRIITNLVKNAIQAIPETRTPVIKVMLQELNDKVLLSVEDNGKGIKQEQYEKIFEPKFTTKGSGMGLGLAMVNNIVQDCGGNIKFNSIPEIGTTFYIYLPKYTP